MSGNAKKYMGMIYQAFINNGYSPNQARAITAEVGRENDFNPNFIFGTHTDRANKKSNLGFLSWQGTRRDKLLQELKKQGLINNKGEIEQSQRSLDAMAKFATDEIRTNKAYQETKRKFLNNPNVDYATAQRVLGKNFILWDYDGNTLGDKVKDHHAKRDKYYQQLGGIIDSKNTHPPTQYTHQGLRLKSNEAIAGGKAHDGIYRLAHDLQAKLGNNLKYYTAFNDGYHHSEAYFKKKGKRDPGLHGAGLAMDIALNDPKHSTAAVAQIRAEMAAKGLKDGVDYKVIDEYANPSKGATGGHLDLRFLSAEAAQKYHTGGNTPAMTPAIRTMPSAFQNFARTEAPNTFIESSPIATTQNGFDFSQPTEKPRTNLSSWGGNQTAQAHPPISTPAIRNDRQEAWRIEDLNFNEPQENPYQDKLAAAFGKMPKTESSIPEHIHNLIKSIYDQA